MVNVSLNGEQWKGFVSFLLVTTLFVIPISPTLKSFFIVFSVAGILATPGYRQLVSSAFSEVWGRAALLLFLVVVMACFWGSADPHTRLVFIEKYSKLLYLPLFAVGFCKRRVRQIGMYAFLLAMLITSVLSFTLFKKTIDPDHVFHNHIITSFMMAFAAYLSGVLCLRERGIKRILLLLSGMIFSYQVIFVNIGRTGYVLYFVLMLLLVIQHLPVKYFAIGIVSFCVVFTLFGYQSTALRSGIQSVVQDWGEYRQGNKETSVGYRLVFHQYAKNLFFASPWLGQGTGGFAEAFQKNNSSSEWNNLLDPHSQYWLLAADTGFLGLCALVYFFASLVLAACRLKEMQAMLSGMLVAFFISNLSDSLLFYSAIGYLFIVFCGLCLGELVESHVAVSAVLNNVKKNDFCELSS